MLEAAVGKSAVFGKAHFHVFHRRTPAVSSLLSVVTQYPASWGKVCRLLSHGDHRCLITLPGDFLCGPSTVAELRGAVFSCFLVCLFWKSGASPLSRRRTENGRVIIITRCHKTALSGLLLSKSGYTHVGSARRSIDIYRK